MVAWIDFITKMICYFLLIWGVWVLTEPLWINSYRMQKRRRRLKKQNKHVKLDAPERENPLHRHIQYLVLALSKDANPKRVVNFYVLTSILFLVNLVGFAVFLKSFFVPLFVATWIGSIPYVWLRYRLTNMRIDTSLAFIKEYHVFFQLYQQTKDVYQTLMKITPITKNSRLQMAYSRLLSSIQKERSKDGVIESTRLFAYTMGSSESSRFSNLFIKTYLEQVDVTEALLDLYKDVQKKEKDLASLKTKRTETVLLGFMPLIFMVLFGWISFRMLMTYETVFVLEHVNFTGFIFALFLAVVSAFSAYLYRKPRADYF